MTILIAVISGICLLVGAFFVVVGGVGILRLPDFFSRLHGSAVMETLGAGLILFGLMLSTGFTLSTVKLIMILIFLLITNPTACHALAQAARAQGLQPEQVQER